MFVFPKKQACFQSYAYKKLTPNKRLIFFLHKSQLVNQIGSMNNEYNNFFDILQSVIVCNPNFTLKNYFPAFVFSVNSSLITGLGIVSFGLGLAFGLVVYSFGRLGLIVIYIRTCESDSSLHRQ